MQINLFPELSSNRNLQYPPLPIATPAKLKASLQDIKQTAKRKQITLDPWEEIEEVATGKQHFTLGCWLFYASRKQHTFSSADRADILRRIFIEGFNTPAYKFFTVFDFGERQFDSLLEMGDSKTVIEILKADPDANHPNVKAAIQYHGW